MTMLEDATELGPLALGSSEGLGRTRADLGEAEKHRDALGVALNKATACGEMLAAVVQGAKEEFVRVPYGASHEDVAAINDWHKMAAEALREWESRT